MTLTDIYLQFTFDMVATQPGEHLHWGLWDGLPHTSHYFADAQEQYAQRLQELIPRGRIADVGCGLGGDSSTARRCHMHNPIS